MERDQGQNTSSAGRPTEGTYEDRVRWALSLLRRPDYHPATAVLRHLENQYDN